MLTVKYKFFAAPSTLNRKECVIHELYDLLEKLRYPEIAQTRFEEFEDTILTETKRIDLLHWLLQESPRFNSISLNKLKDNARNDKLFKYYSHIGLCNDINILLGKCDIEKQLQFFTLLILFIKNVYLIKTETQENEQIASLQTNVESINEDFNTDSYAENKTKSNEIKIIGSPNNVINKQSHKKYYNLEGFCTRIKENIKILSDQKTNSFEPVLQKFNIIFKKITFFTTQAEHSSVSSKCCVDLCFDIQNIHSAILNVNKTLVNEEKIKNRDVLEISTKTIKPLTTAIKDNIVLNEQARNMINKSIT